MGSAPPSPPDRLRAVIFEGDAGRMAGELVDVTITETTGHTLCGDAALG